MAVVSRTARQKSWQIADDLGSLLRALDENERSLGDRLRDLARARGLTSDEEAARHIDVSYRQYQRWLAGKSEPTGRSLTLISTAYGQDALGYLFGAPDKSQLDRIEELLERLVSKIDPYAELSPEEEADRVIEESEAELGEGAAGGRPGAGRARSGPAGPARPSRRGARRRDR